MDYFAAEGARAFDDISVMTCEISHRIGIDKEGDKGYRSSQDRQAIFKRRLEGKCTEYSYFRKLDKINYLSGIRARRGGGFILVLVRD